MVALLILFQLLTTSTIKINCSKPQIYFCPSVQFIICFVLWSGWIVVFQWKRSSCPGWPNWTSALRQTSQP